MQDRRRHFQIARKHHRSFHEGTLSIPVLGNETFSIPRPYTSKCIGREGSKCPVDNEHVKYGTNLKNIMLADIKYFLNTR